ncbi:hypothetical protein IC582_021484 [Cucumis melo]
MFEGVLKNVELLLGPTARSKWSRMWTTTFRTGSRVKVLRW